MKRSLQTKLLVIVVVFLGSLWSLWPTLQMTQPSFDQLTEAEQKDIRDRAIRRGLDLEGGMYMILEVDVASLPEEVSEDEALERTVEVLRNRIDEFGVAEPVIQREGANRIVVQLPGVDDPDRAVEIIKRTARLEFRLLRTGTEVTDLVARLDRVSKGLSATEPEAETTDDANADPEVDDTDVATADTTGSDIDDILATNLEPEDVTDVEAGFAAMLGPYVPNFDGYLVRENDRAAVTRELEREELARLMNLADFTLLWSAETLPMQDGSLARILYAVETAVGLDGTEIENATITPDPQRPPAMMVSLNFSRRGGLIFANLTGANVGRKLAIVLDNGVISAPVIQNKITGGHASISGGFANDEEAADLALMLRAGSLPAEVLIEEERTVGPSLGADSIRQGVRSVMVGGALVIVFMIIYYRAAGLLATAGLLLTLMFLLGVLAQLGLTLTLPGIAGIILTVGMAVDANVLIFERIREELRAKKSVRAAIDSGYAQATRAILDANITTFIAAVVLFWFGTGPIKGFAVTLALGIMTSMFSALIFTRSIYELWLGDRAPKSLSI